ncbi:MAG: methyltransferase domain-containing protein [Ignavibacteriae bacterium]|nr:methyltransferase domain-containing protein [Ignavibacteriota bacterium]
MSDSPFSDIAASYDAEFSALPEVRRLRERVYALAREFFPKRGLILELGCGTGVDARLLAEEGWEVVASDPSSRMLAETRAACEDLPTVYPLRMPAEHLACVRDRGVDGVFSNFGALNCVRHLEPVLRDIYHVLPDNGVAILCLMNRFSITETVAYLRRGRLREAFRRWRWNGVSVPVGHRHVLTWYHSLRSIKRMIRGRFTIVRVVGLNVLTPPPSFTYFHERAPRLMALARRMERRLDTLPIFSVLGDHFVIVLERFE